MQKISKLLSILQPSSLCKYPLQGKITFANWGDSAVDKYDTKLRERGHQLIHVPRDKGSADRK